MFKQKAWQHAFCVLKKLKIIYMINKKLVENPFTNGNGGLENTTNKNICVNVNSIFIKNGPEIDDKHLIHNTDSKNIYDFEKIKLNT